MSSDESTKIHLIIPTHDRTELLARTVRSVYECIQPDTEVELTIVENGGRFGGEALIGDAPDWLNARYLHCQDANKSVACNQTLAGIDSGLVLFIDDDIRVGPNFFVAYASVVQEHPNDLFFCGPMGVDYESAPPEWLKKFLPYSAKGWEHDKLTLNQPAGMGGNWGAMRKVLAECGEFSVLHGPGAKTGSVGQETEMQTRMLKRGGVGRYVPEARVWHYVPIDRCSREWTLNRAYRNGISFGLNNGEIAGKGVCFGIPFPMLVEVAGVALRHYLTGWMRSVPERFRNQYSYKYHCGTLAGHRVWLKQSK